MAREKVLYDGHAVAAVAATSEVDRQEGAEADQGRLRGAAARDRSGRGDAAGRADPARPSAHQGRQGRRTSPPTWSSGSNSPWATSRRASPQADVDRRARVRHQADAPGLYRAAGLRRQLRPRTARSSCGAAPRGHFVVRDRLPDMLKIDAAEDPRHASRSSAAASAARPTFYAEPVAIAAVAQGQAAGEDRADAQRGVPRHRPGLRHPFARQDGRHQGRQDHRRRGRAGLPDRRLHRLDVLQRAAGDVHALRSGERQDGRPTRWCRTGRR